MIRTEFCLDDLYSSLCAELPQDLSNVCFDFSIDDLSAVLRSENDVIVASPLGM